jgi:RNA polymerase sigma-70 factor (ECF subfamily)
LRARVDPSDVVQEVQFAAARRMDDYLNRQPMPFRLWLRKTAQERMINLCRDHLRRGRRSDNREEPIPYRSSLLLAQSLRAGEPSPSEHARARELAMRVEEALAAMSAEDREILLMRNVEKLPYDEIACLLDIEAAAARKRYGRALIRLQRGLGEEGVSE